VQSHAADASSVGINAGILLHSDGQGLVLATQERIGSCVLGVRRRLVDHALAEGGRSVPVSAGTRSRVLGRVISASLSETFLDLHGLEANLRLELVGLASQLILLKLEQCLLLDDDHTFLLHLLNLVVHVVVVLLNVLD
jgi:hypothetical protein